jgi:hypothetical protein
MTSHNHGGQFNLDSRSYLGLPMTTHDGEASAIFAGIESMVIDRATSRTWVIMTDGTAAWAPTAPSTFTPTSIIARTTYVPRANRLVVETVRGDTIEAELPTLKHPAPTHGRPVVYLDQKDWSRLADVLFDPERVQSISDRDAASYLIDLARSNKIILPMSFAHFTETSRWPNAERRPHLALTLTQLSRGWLMRHPIDVWQYEFRQTFASRYQQVTVPLLDVFTLDACSAQSQDTFQELEMSSAGFPKGVEYVGRATICLSSYIDAVLNSEPTPRSPIPEWVDGFQLITDELAKVPAPSSRKRKLLRFPLLKDVIPQVTDSIAQSGITQSEFEVWIETHFNRDVGAMNCFGLWNEVFQDKHLETTTKWRENDLIDMLFLTCAAGYADYLLCEASMWNLLRQAAKRLGRPIRVYSRITDLAADLKSEGL